MLNFYDYISNSKYYKTFKVDDLLFVEYKCLIREDTVAYWTSNNYFSYILSGVTKYINGEKEYVVRHGDAVFVRKGTYIAQRHSSGDYCALVIFVSDEFIRKVVEKYPAIAPVDGGLPAVELSAMFPLTVDESLSTYFHSVLSYFSREVAPSSDLLKIKFEELLLNVLTGAPNRALAQCLRSLRGCGKVSLREVMETSFMYPMSLEEYARLCARSLSAFKSEFQEVYGTSPGRWLMAARLQYAKVLLETTEDAVSDVAFRSGFKNTAHFIRVFKEQYGAPPNQYRMKVSMG